MKYQDPNESALPKPGTYKAKVHNVTCDLRKPDKPRITVSYKLESGQLLFQNMMVSDNSTKYLAWQLGQLGIWQAAWDKIGKDKDVDNNTVTKALVDASQKYLGQLCEVEVKHREWEGKTFADVHLNEVVKLKNHADGLTQTQAPQLNTADELPF